MEGHRVGGLQTERRVERLTTVAEQVAAIEHDRRGTSIDGQNLTTTWMVDGVVVRAGAVGVPDQQTVLVREALDPVRPGIGEAEVVRTCLQRGVVTGVYAVLREVELRNVGAGRATHAGEARGGPAVVARLDVVGKGLDPINGQGQVVKEGTVEVQATVCGVAEAELHARALVGRQVIVELRPDRRCALPGNGAAVDGSADLAPGGATIARDLSIEVVVARLDVVLRPRGERRRRRSTCEIDRAGQGGAEVVSRAAPPLEGT